MTFNKLIANNLFLYKYVFVVGIYLFFYHIGSNSQNPYLTLKTPEVRNLNML